MNFSLFKLVLISVLISASVQAQNYQLTKYSIESGLPQSQINDVIQDDLGYIENYSKLKGHKNAPSTHVQLVDTKGILLDYMIKYIANKKRP